eukprot:TRINITY_DN367_c0_g1_i1.p1 TRINITY_DN367_c0_g1~~TRINITY_DN367_c0_g1_i1.p1  ORF type:complete len:471 (-),score=96.91 TRINITY_DN367_c0_g1_i1:93-1505(-)
MHSKLLLLLVSTLSLCGVCFSWSLSDGSFALPVKNLPGLSEQPNFLQYSGYVNVNTTINKMMFFWFVESQNDPASSPVVLWLNGGPGCSSLLGILTENGPFLVDETGTVLSPNPYSWNMNANVIYLETPAGVGFSYVEKGEYVSGDNSTAKDNYNFLLGFFQLFPQFAKQPFFIAGESFAGHYVPEVAYEVLMGNGNGNGLYLDLQGFMCGNPSFIYSVDSQWYIPFMAFHGFLSQDEYQLANATCQGQFYPPPNNQCDTLINKLIDENFALINPYNVEDDCIGSGPNPTGGCFTTQLLAARSKRTLGGFGQTAIPCLSVNGVSVYFNQTSVRQALNVVPQSLSWNACSQVLEYNQFAPTMIPYYLALLGAGVRGLVYSGDLDSCVPYLGTYECVKLIGLPIQTQWHPWIVVDQSNMPQVAGFAITYQGNNTSTAPVTYTTIRGSGHMVPSYKPLQAYEMFSRFINDEPL